MAVTRTLESTEMKRNKAKKLVGWFVRISPGGANPNHGCARLVEVRRRTAMVKPFGHGHLEKVRLADMREWKSANEAERARRRRRGT